MITCEIAGNLENPTALAAVRCVVDLEGTEEGLLGQVLGGHAIAQRSSEKPVNRLAVSSEEAVDEVARGRSSHQMRRGSGLTAASAFS